MQKQPSLSIALVPIILLIILLGTNVWLFGDNTLSGSNQITLLFSGAIAAFIGFFYGTPWEKMLNGAIKSISSAMGALIILLLIGCLAGTWMLSGIVPAMIYYGLDILNPSIFLFACCVVCAIVSLATGSSWSTIATIGIAMLGIGKALEIHEGLTCGAIISGAYFGDKMSPLSDTTNLAPAMAGTDLVTHIKYMMWTTIPSIIISLILFLIIGFVFFGSDVEISKVGEMQNAISKTYNINPWLFLVPVIVIFMIVKKVPAIPALLFGTLAGGLFAIIFQSDIIREQGTEIKGKLFVNEIPKNYIINISEDNSEFDFFKSGNNQVNHNFQTIHADTNNSINADLKNLESGGVYSIKLLDTLKNISFHDKIIINKNSEKNYFNKKSGNIIYGKDSLKYEIHIGRTKSYVKSSYKAVMNAMTINVAVDTGNSDVNDLVETYGMSGMLNTIWLIICAMSFGGIMEATGLLKRITSALMNFVKSRKSLVLTTSSTCIFLNLTASDQYLSIVVPGRMFADSYKKYNLHPKNLSRTLEDSATVTSVLVPWNTCGATQAGVLGVATIIYLPYCFFNLLSPIMTLIFSYASIKIAKLKSADETSN